MTAAKSVLLFGAPKRGDEFVTDSHLIQCVSAPDVPVTVALSPIEKIPYTAITYHVETYRESQEAPDRERQFFTGRPADYQMSDDDTRQIEQRLHGIPWDVFPGNILYDFQQWFAHQVHRHTGWLWWDGCRVYE